MSTIAIDFGASFIKAALIENECIKKRIIRSTPDTVASHDFTIPSKIYRISDNVKEIIEELSGDDTEINICISNEMHGFVLLDEDGKPLTDYISWQEEYGNISIEGVSSCEILSDEKYVSDVQRTGMWLRGGLPSANLLFLKRKNCISNERYYFYMLGDAVLKMIFGNAPDCHVSNAAATGLYDLENGRWNQALTELMGENLIFPKVGTNIRDVFYLNKEYHLFPPIGDYQAALLGAGIDSSQDISFNLGTGAQISVLTDEMYFSKDYQIVPFFGNRFLKRIPHLPSGRALNVFFRFTKDVLSAFDVHPEDDRIWDVVLSSADKADDKYEMKCGLGFFENPVEPSDGGSIEHIGEYELTLANLINSVLERESTNFIQAAERLVSDEKKLERVIFSGGVAKKIPFIREKILEHYDGEPKVIIAEDETLLGLNKYSLLSEEER